MAAASHFQATVYGRIWGQAPYQGSTSNDAFANSSAFDTPAGMSFPVSSAILHPVSPGQRVGTSTNYIYSVIEVVTNGLVAQPGNIKYGAGESVSTLATDAG
jgi:hypothetical protein